MIEVIESNFEATRLGGDDLWQSLRVPSLPDDAESRWAEAVAVMRSAARDGDR